MLASVEKNKVVYIVNRDAEGGIVISSPHEANQWASLCFAMCALDTGWEHPVFATLEVDYNDAENDPTGEMYERREKQLVYYTVDLGLNHVVRSWSDTVDYSANKIFGVPGGQDGPSGVIVCCEDRIFYRHDKSQPMMVPIPRRMGPTEDPQRKRTIVAGCLHLARGRGSFFFLLQTDDGDVFKLTITMGEDAQGRKTSVPERLNLKYYETYPVARQMLLMRKGYIYLAAENGNTRLYHVNDLADDLSVEPWNNFTSDDFSADPTEPFDPVYFRPRGERYTSIAVDVPSQHPLMRTIVDNPNQEDAPQIYAIQGTGNRSAFKTIRHGLEITEIVASPLGNLPYENLWSLKHRSSDNYHSYLLLSSNYGDKTIVLSIGDEVETMDNSPFLTNRASLEAKLMGDSTLVQVHARGVRSILEDERINEWPSPAHRTIVAASANERQLLLGLSSAELAFFFMGEDGVLSQLEEMPEMSGKITALAVASTPHGQMQAKYAVVGCDDCTIRVLSIELDSPLEPRSVQALSAVPTSLEVVEQIDPNTGTSVSYVHIGLQSGLYLRAVIDDVTGELGEVRTKFLGAKPTRLFPVEISMGPSAEPESCILACSSRPWLGYNHPVSHLYTLAPLVTAPLDAARAFVSEHINGLCAIQGTNLLIFEANNLEGRLATEEVRLRYTPRSMVRNPWYPIWYVVQSEGNALSEATKKGLLAGTDKSSLHGVNGTNGDTDVKMEDEENPNIADGEADGATDPEELERHLGLAKGTGHWASCISAIDPYDAKAITANVELGDNEAALCVAAVPFESRTYEVFLAVGTGQHMQPGTGVQSKGYVHIYRLTEEGKGLEFVHKVRPLLSRYCA
jgi:splicing factor 3B subunit 3